MKVKSQFYDVKRYVKEFTDLSILSVIISWHRSKDLSHVYDPNRTANIALIFTQMVFYLTFYPQIYIKILV